MNKKRRFVGNLRGITRSKVKKNHIFSHFTPLLKAIIALNQNVICVLEMEWKWDLYFKDGIWVLNWRWDLLAPAIFEAWQGHLNVLEPWSLAQTPLVTSRE